MIMSAVKVMTTVNSFVRGRAYVYLCVCVCVCVFVCLCALYHLREVEEIYYLSNGQSVSAGEKEVKKREKHRERITQMLHHISLFSHSVLRQTEQAYATHSYRCCSVYNKQYQYFQSDHILASRRGGKDVEDT